ncbi:MAG: type VI secretion lipoprotein TssJ [Deltaproteobacteria bacterium]|nr:MAG: type VI secretion lipoprotein TssJ [Deltaproteobacteria bacterium]
MRKYVEKLNWLIIIFFVGACASPPPTPPEWRYEKEAIHLRVKADPQLNFYQGMPHTLMLCVYQLREPNVYDQHATNKAGLYKLLECGLFDASVTGSKRFIIKPGEDSNFGLDRFEGTEYVGIVTGYYLIEKERILRLTDIPVIEKRKNWTIWKKISTPGALNIELKLGPQQIQKFEVK